MSINPQNIVNVRGENAYLDQLASRPGWGLTTLMTYGTTDLKGEWQTLSSVGCEMYMKKGREIGISELAKEIIRVRSLLAQYENKSNNLVQRCSVLEKKASETEANLQAMTVKFNTVEKQCEQYRTEAQAMDLMAANIAELKAALQLSQENTVTIENENRELKLKQESLESDLLEARVRLKQQKKNHRTEIAQIQEKHSKEVTLMLKTILMEIKANNPVTDNSNSSDEEA